MRDVIIIGGGAAGFFTAIKIKEEHPSADVLLLEKTDNLLQKVKISGGGRCNVTHACFIPKDLSKHYPRGERELLGPFNRFMTGDTMEWFESRGVPLKIESDNRVFPVSNSSQSIIDCLMNLASTLGVEIMKKQGLKFIERTDFGYEVQGQSKRFQTKNLVITTGSSKQIWNELSRLGLKIVPPVPSLFTFHISDKRIEGLQGLSVPKARIKVLGTKKTVEGPMLITHWGLSGPAVLRLSSEQAQLMHQMDYKFELSVNWLNLDLDEVEDLFVQCRNNWASKDVYQNRPDQRLPKRLWERMLIHANIDKGLRWADLSKKQIMSLQDQFFQSRFKVFKKATFKDEFVTAGGVDLKEINFKRFESKKFPGLYFAGEVLNIDAVTGGFNFQNAWTGGYIAGESIAESIKS